MTFFRYLAQGFSYPYRAIRLLFKSKAIIRITVILVIINIFVFAAVFVGGVFWFSENVSGWMQLLLPANGSWYWSIVEFLSSIVIWIVFLVFVFIVFVLLSKAVAAPFYSKIAEKTVTLMTGIHEDEKLSVATVLLDMGRSVWHALLAVCELLLVYTITLPLNLVPIIGSFLYGVLTMYFTFYVICREFLDYPFEKHRMTYRQKRSAVWERKGLLIGFGSSVFLLLLIPLINLLVTPVAVIGATMMYCEVFSDETRTQHATS